MTDDDALIARIRALSDVAYWANVEWIIPGDATQAIGKLAVEAAARIAALTARIAELESYLWVEKCNTGEQLVRAEKAEAALRQAVPREPTQAMWQAARDAIPDCHMNIDEIWRAMYDAALKDKP